jgi:hypothetical protein
MTFHRIQIKRSVSNPYIPILEPGELAFTQSGNNFYIGSPDNISGNIRIGHKLHDGVLTPNEALVANSTGSIDRVSTANLDVGIINANGSPGSEEYILYSSGPNGNVFWSALRTETVNTSASYTFRGHESFANDVTFFNGIEDKNEDTGKFGQYLMSTGANSVQWQAPYYITTQLYNYTQYGLGWMNIAPNQNTETLGFLSDVKIPYGSIWLLAKNPGTDPTPITIYSPSTILTPMMWISGDKSGPYNADTNPNGQDYWFNITPPPAFLG